MKATFIFASVLILSVSQAAPIENLEISMNDGGNYTKLFFKEEKIGNCSWGDLNLGKSIKMYTDSEMIRRLDSDITFHNDVGIFYVLPIKLKLQSSKISQV